MDGAFAVLDLVLEKDLEILVKMSLKRVDLSLDPKEEAILLLGKLTELQLQEISTGFKLTVKAGKTGSKKALYNGIVRFLASEEVEESEDEGLELFTKLRDDVKALLQEDELEDEVEDKFASLKAMFSGGGNVQSSESSRIAEEREKRELQKLMALEQELRDDGTQGNAVLRKLLEEEKAKERAARTPQVDIHKLKLKEFKVSGVVGTEENALDWSSLCFAMKEGKELGFAEKEIRSGVIKAMKSGSSTRRYFQGISSKDLTEQQKQAKFLKLLREIYDTKESTELLQEMVNCVQETTQTEKNYVLKMMGLRDNILAVTEIEECPLGEVLVRKGMMRAIAVGLRKDTVRTQLQDALEDHNMEDDELLRKINKVVSRDAENRKKMGASKSGKAAGVNFVDANNNKEQSSGDVVNEGILALIQKLEAMQTKQSQQMLEMQKQIVSVQQLSVNGGGNQQGRSGGMDQQCPGDRGISPWRPFVKCTECQKTNAFCTHCTNCGETGHKRFNCPKPKNM